MADSLSKQEPPYGLRMPPDLKARVKAAADANNRSMNAEIVATLEKAYPVPMMTSSQLLKALTESIPSSPPKSPAEKAHLDEFLGMLQRMVDDDPNYPLVPLPVHRSRPQKSQAAPTFGSSDDPDS